MSKPYAVLTIVAALSCEVRPWLDLYRVKKVASKPFDYYRSDEQRVEIVISGVGSLAMSTAVGWVGGQGADARVWLNLGTAGHATRSLGDIIRVHGSADSESGRAHYPPMTAKWRGDSEAVLSYAAPEVDYPGGAAVDMEASAFFTAATRFSSSELVQSLKVISDNEISGIDQLNAEKITTLMQAHVSVVDQFGHALRALMPARERTSRFEDFTQLRATVSQQQQLHELLHKVHVLDLNKEVDALALEKKASIKSVLTALRSVVEAAVPVVGEGSHG